MQIEDDIQTFTNRINKKNDEYNEQILKLDKDIKTYTCWAWSFVVGGFIVGILGVFLYCTRCSNESFGLNLLGDFYGGSVASIWSLAGLFFIYVAFLGQKQQLLNQQIEIMYSQLEVKHTRLELEGQKKEMMEQNRTLKQQRFENTFFQLLRNHQEIVNGIDITSKNNSTNTWTVVSQGRDCFKTFYDRFRDKSRYSKSKNIVYILKSYMDFYQEHQSDLGHYFRNLYHILKYIHNSEDISIEDKFKYTSLLRALLSSYELSLLFYNGLGDYGKEHFKSLIETYSFLKNLDISLLIDKKHKSEYDELAFASSIERKQLTKP